MASPPVAASSSDLAAAGVASYKAGRHAEAISHLSAALECMKGSRSVVLKNRAAAQAELGEWALAESDLTEAIAQSSSSSLVGRCLLKRSYARSKLERHALAETDARDAASRHPEVARLALEQAARCRSALKADVITRAKDDEFGKHLVHSHQTLRFWLASNVPLKLDGDLELKIRLGNEFGLWRHSDWMETVGGRERVDLRVEVHGEGLEVNGDVTMGREGQATVKLKRTGNGECWVKVSPLEVWKRPALGVATLPIDSGNDKLASLVESCGATACRELRLLDGSIRLAEAVGTLGIAGKLWDAALTLLEHISTDAGCAEAIKGSSVLELGCGVGAVGLACATFLEPRAVWLSDLAMVTPLLKLNIALNSSCVKCRPLALDWADPQLPSALLLEPPEVVLMSDVVYDPGLHEPLLQTIAMLLAEVKPKLVLMAHRHRNPHDADFFKKLREMTLVTHLTTTTSNSSSTEDHASFLPTDVHLFQISSRQQQQQPPPPPPQTPPPPPSEAACC